jgi:hypothetical protein
MWVANGTGDLFRSGPIAQFPPDASPLTIWTLPGQQLTQANLDQAAALFPLGTTISIPWYVQAAFAAAIFPPGLTIPLTLTPTSGSLTLPAPGGASTLNLHISGTIRIRRFFWVVTKSFALAITFILTPSADPVEPYRIVAVNAALGTSFGIPGIGLPSWVQDYFGQLIADIFAPNLESQLNSTLFPMVRDALAAGIPPAIPPQQMTQTATVSLASLKIDSTGITPVIAIGDLFGLAVVPIPPPPPPTTVPDVVGDEVTVAARTLEAANLVFYARSEVPDPNVTVPTVVAQTPAAGASVPQGSWIACTVHKPQVEHH